MEEDRKQYQHSLPHLRQTLEDPAPFDMYYTCDLLPDPAFTEAKQLPTKSLFKRWIRSQGGSWLYISPRMWTIR